jgi:hypothetical protein
MDKKKISSKETDVVFVTIAVEKELLPTIVKALVTMKEWPAPPKIRRSRKPARRKPEDNDWERWILQIKQGLSVDLRGGAPVVRFHGSC